MNQGKEASLVQREVAANAAGGIGGVPPLSFLSPGGEPPRPFLSPGGEPPRPFLSPGGEPPRPFLSPASCVIWPTAPGVINHHPEHRSIAAHTAFSEFWPPDYRAAGNTVS